MCENDIEYQKDISITTMGLKFHATTINTNSRGFSMF